eukprot:g13694.t1
MSQLTATNTATFAVAGACEDVIKELIAKYKEEFPKCDPFIAACKNGRLQDVQAFVQSGTIKDVDNYKGQVGNSLSTPLFAAYEHQHVIDYLLVSVIYKDCADVARKYINAFPKRDPFLSACEDCHLKDVEAFIESGTIKDISGTGKRSASYSSMTPLEVANKCESKSVYNYLINTFYKSDLEKKYAREFGKGSPFIVACERGRLQDVKEFVESGIIKDANRIGKTLNGKDTTPLSAAASALPYSRGAHHLVVDYLIDILYKDSPDEERSYRKEFPLCDPFIIACQKGRLKDVQIFIESGTVKDINKEGKCSYRRDCRPLEIAADKEVIDYLIDYQLKGATDIESIEAVYRASCPKGVPYIVACEKGRLRDVQIFIESGTIKDINKTEKGVAGPDIESCGRIYPRTHTPLEAASRNEHYQTTTYLLSLPSIKIRYALHYAARHNKKNLKVLNLLLNHKSFSIDLLNQARYNGSYEETALDLCYDYRRSIRNDKIELLISKGANFYRYSLHYHIQRAVEEDNFQDVKLLLKHERADIRRLGKSGNTVLHDAAERCKRNLNVLKLLMSHRTFSADILNYRYIGRTVLDVAYKSILPIKNDMVELIKSKGGKCSAENINVKVIHM